ncbi:phosphoribosylglycinamide formyltransferase [Trichothermofontia sp.]
MDVSLSAEQTPSLVSPPLIPLSHATSARTTPARLGVMASGSGTNFEAIMTAIAAQELHATVPLLIYNNLNAAVTERAKRWGVPAKLLNHREFPNRESLDQAIVAALQAEGVEWVIMAGWMRIITHVLLDTFPDRVLNIHPSLLPSFPGVRAVEQALAAGVKVTGCTVHRACLAVDSGPIIIQAAVPVLPDDTPDRLHARIQIQEHRILPQAIALVTGQIRH